MFNILCKIIISLMCIIYVFVYKFYIEIIVIGGIYFEKYDVFYGFFFEYLFLCLYIDMVIFLCIGIYEGVIWEFN